MNHQILKKIIYEQHEVIKNSLIVERDVFLEKDANYVLVGLRRAGKSTMLYIEERPLIFMTAAFGGYYQQPFQVRLSASVCGSHHFSVVQVVCWCISQTNA